MNLRFKPLLILMGVFSTLTAVAQQQAPWEIPDDYDPAYRTPVGTSGSSGGPVNEDPGPRVPDGPSNNGSINDPHLAVLPAPDFWIRGGYAATADDHGVNNGGGVGVVMLLEGGRTGLMVGGEVAGTEGGVFAYAQGDAKLRYRMPIDKNHIIWGGVGLDIQGRGAVDERTQSFLRVQLPTAFIGTMVTIGNDCVIHLFAKAAFGIYDNQVQSSEHWGANWDNFARPAVGAEAFAACGSIRVIADYQHTFTFGPGGDTDRAALSFAQTFPVGADGAWQVGYFVKGEYVREGAISGVSADQPGGTDRNMGGVFGGLEVRWGASPKKK